MSLAFITCLSAFLLKFSFRRDKPKSAAGENQNQSYQDLLMNIDAFVRKRYKQRPQLSTSRQMVRVPTHRPCVVCQL